MMLRRVNRYLTRHALKLRTLMEWRQTSVLKNLHRWRFNIFYRLLFSSYRGGLLLEHALAHATIPHMWGLNGVYICGRDMHACSITRNVNIPCNRNHCDRSSLWREAGSIRPPPHISPPGLQAWNLWKQIHPPHADSHDCGFVYFRVPGVTS